MYRYLFTNDLRTSTLTLLLKDAANFDKNNIFTKGQINSIATARFYFNIYENTNCRRAVLNGDIYKVIVNFVKKFQFPNIRSFKENEYQEQVLSGEKVTPLRTIIKVLYILSYILPDDNNYLTFDEILRFIFLDPQYTNTLDINYLSLINNLLKSRMEDRTDSDKTSFYWPQSDRQLREMLNILVYIKLVSIENERIFICRKGNELAIQEIINFNQFWEESTNDIVLLKLSYQKYMDIDIDDCYFNVEQSAKFDKQKFLYSPRYITSLLAKPFVILTGNSGTGKTRIARQFAEYLKKENESGESNILIVPVGADWTDNTKILGYFNPLADDGAGVYVKTEIFRFLERANANPQIPFFLILDEMNLSHVERYFSDFLSKMEIPGSAFEIDGYGTLPYPKNLFVTGTVNIDETTYMFSPKVLDRANVIEFKPEKNSVLTSLTAETEEASLAAEPGMAEGFLQLAEKIRNASATDYNNIDFTAAEPILSELYDILQKAGFEFAFRTVKEIRQYLIAAYELEEEKENFSLNGHLDIQILQKILPKIYGNRQQVGTLLEELKAFFEKEHFQQSLQKVAQMAERLSRFQFVSFV